MKLVTRLGFACVVSFLLAACSQPGPRRDGPTATSVPTATTEYSGQAYPAHWWTPIPKEGAPAWEILPQEARPPEVILSKRHELGILSNFAPTPFVFHGKTYASLEGFWQSMLYPESAEDPRAKVHGVEWKYTREQVTQMVSFEAKHAGDLAYENMKKMRIDWVSFEGKRFPYWTQEKGEHYRLILEAMREKLAQNPKVRDILLSTRGLQLRPDHHQETGAPPEWRYFEIWMKLRDELRPRSAGGSSSRNASAMNHPTAAGRW